MSNTLELTSFEHLDLCLAMLVSNQKRLEGAHQEILKPPEYDQDFRPLLETSYRLIREVQQLLQDSQDALQPADGHPSKECRLPQLDWMEDLQQALEKARVMAESLRRLPSVSLQQFESFGFFVCHWVTSFRESRQYASTWWRQQHERRIRPLRGSLQTAVADRRLQSQVEEVFGQLLYVLCLIRHCQQALESCQDRQQLILMMVRCNECARGVLAQMEDLQRVARAQDNLGQVLCWSSCALKIELRRVLRSDLYRLDAEVNSNACFERLDRAIGILLNGFDYIIRQLLSSFDPAFDGDSILGDLQEQYQNSCQLRDSLENLKEAAQDVEKSPSTNALSSLQQAIQDFTPQAFNSLYRRDRRVIEEFSHQVEASDPQETAFKAHQFQTFLTALLAEVSNRNVFAQFEQPGLVS